MDHTRMKSVVSETIMLNLLESITRPRFDRNAA